LRTARITRAPRSATAVAADLIGGLDTHAVRQLDLANLDSVRRFAHDTSERIDVLVNNAGVSNATLLRTDDGFESQFGTNHLGHFLLTNLLLPQITSKVVTVSSQAERMGRLDLNDLNWHDRPYAAGRAYADSKLANLLFTLELDRRLRSSGSAVRAIAAHPGLVVTAIYDRPAEQKPGIWDRLLPLLGQGPDKGALPVLFAMTGALPGGTFTGPEHLFHMRDGAQVITSSAASKNETLAAELWSASEELTKTAATL
jgi:NAD(P)-dependent dehydrogenase (short-subunit alcohol dehydrogenase family)